MEESQFNQLVDDTLISIEEAIEEVIDEGDLDIDYDTIAGILSLEFTDGSKIIINRQAALNQLWVAARSGGFHLDYLEGGWYCKTEQCTLSLLLNRLCTEQAPAPVNLSLN